VVGGGAAALPFLQASSGGGSRVVRCWGVAVQINCDLQISRLLFRCLRIGALGAAFVRYFCSVLCLFVGRRWVVGLCHRSAAGGLFYVVLCWFWRSLSFLDVTRKGLVRRCSVLAVAVIHVPSDFLWGLVVVVVLFICLGLVFLFHVSFVERGLCWFLVLFLLPSRPSFCALYQPPPRRWC